MKHPADTVPALGTPGSVSAQLMLVSEGGPAVLDAYATDATPGVDGRRRAERSLRKQLLPCLAELHDRLIASNEHSVLVVLQGLDACGKSGTVKHVGPALNPAGVCVAKFKEPDPSEEREHFLERIRRQLPEPGQIAFFDRSHYEDAIVPRVAGELDEAELDQRLAEIREFEVELVDAGTIVVKCLLHLSYDEQRRRFLRRLDRPDKQWKFSESDLETRAQWPMLQAVYGEVVGRTSVGDSPWFLVPADHKWYRNWAVASLLIEHLAAVRSEYPTLEFDADAIRDRLQPPN